jgi:putative intracellular protease/amidase
MDTAFTDGAWRCPVVSPEERDLALRFLKPGSQEQALLKRENLFDLGQLAKPPQVGDYLKDKSLLRQYRQALRKALEISDQYDAIIIAGGSGAIPGFMDDRGLQSLILAFHNLGKPIMGECNGGLVIAQTIDPRTGESILAGRAVTTHSWLDEYQSGWGWTSAFSQDTDTFWSDGRFDLKAYQLAEKWDSPGVQGNPLIDSEGLFKMAAGPGGLFFSPAGSLYSVVVDENLITCRTTPDGYPGVLALMAVMDGRPGLRGRLFIDADECGKRQSVLSPANAAYQK